MSISGFPCKLAFVFLLVGVVVALGGVLIATFIADWFSWLENALSDLGHAVRHRETAVLFNGSLLIGGSLIIVGSVFLFLIGEKLVMIGFFLVGLGLILVGGFDEVYGRVHFVVSVFLFSSLGLLLIFVALRLKSMFPIISFAIGLVFWIVHFELNIPRGVAIPEIISVLVTIPWALLFILKRCF